MQTKTYHTTITENDLNAAMASGDRPYEWDGTTCILAQAIARTVGSPLLSLSNDGGTTKNGIELIEFSLDAQLTQRNFDREFLGKVRESLPVQFDFTATTKDDTTVLP